MIANWLFRISLMLQSLWIFAWKTRSLYVEKRHPHDAIPHTYGFFLFQIRNRDYRNLIVREIVQKDVFRRT